MTNFITTSISWRKDNGIVFANNFNVNSLLPVNHIYSRKRRLKEKQMIKLTHNSSATLAILTNEEAMVLMTTEQIKDKIEQLRDEWLTLRWYRHVKPEDRKRVEEVRGELAKYKSILKYIQTQHKWEIGE